MQDQLFNFLNCPRCGDQAYQRLNDYTYCASCNYSNVTDVVIENFYEQVPDWALSAQKPAKVIDIPNSTEEGSIEEELEKCTAG